ncbi:hypothetical protein [Protaetiibacter larvae]|uniref:Ammonium transporter AmtB-like domain-containing protein n=1 Tax=Protaetiibacter larvae TaxID=2592654 RepID=A0A5C1Y8E5_9MICO|nr:hypothetical protein [Protaetiibacter larvae]QEO10161.1 hypothetical protein FLP23_09160 [Protaetiibacter larvae]
MPALVALAALASAVMTVAVAAMFRPAGRRVAVLRAILATALATVVTAGAGTALRADTPEFLMSVSFAVAPVAILLGAAAEEAAPGRRRVAWSLVLGWALVVFPASVIVPPLVFAACTMPECRVEDFGGGLALLVSSAASALLAWRAHVHGAEQGWARFAVPVLVLWLGGALWLMSLEGAIDSYTGRILLAALLSPLAGGAAWLIVDLLRQASRHPLRSVADGVVAGLVAIVPGAATVSFPWSATVGAAAGAAAALVYGARRIASAGRGGHWALVVLASTAIGYLAPAVSGDTIGLLFSGRIAALLPPLAAFLAIAAFGVVTSVPSWLMRGPRRASDATRRTR